MNRRSLLRTVGAGVVVGGSGCLGGGGEVIVSVQQDVSVDPGDAWMETDIPNLSESGGAIEYIVRAERAFDVYFFTDESNFERYNAYIKGDDPEETPPGNDEFSQAAVPAEGKELYEATTDNGGNRQPVQTAGPYYFVVDHSNYRMENRVEEFDDPLQAFVDLKVIRNRSLI
ncbi:hypothetical protein [Haloarcula onubensis]|uniref:Twin-arginine translocation signal domain-containing protein n=1 Tax=Haloarcula onubensis TaxID=2950539 RepID=A0ABU2FN28_9EURY|nr:hypothetical protein [Halomicroarcula sp. S3CR25-11]MDS0282153.1 hypothetical protein [Halomicroarcula sp. S3CR25-11]